jgi:hypothetical protein
MTGAALIVCAAEDAAAGDLARRLAPDCLIVTPPDLSRAGWTYAGDPALRRGVADDGPFTVVDLCGVVTRLVAIESSQLPHVRAVDREYVAAEETAFLRAWLRGLPVPVINPPVPMSLSGPMWQPVQWAALAAGLGIDTLAAQQVGGPTRAAPDTHLFGPEPGDHRVVVCGRGVLRGPGLDDRYLTQTQQLAAAADVPYLTAYFRHDRLSGVDTWPAPTEPEVLDLVAAELRNEPAGFRPPVAGRTSSVGSR